MATPTVKGGAVAAPNQWVESNGRRLAYRTVGAGTPLVLCTRFRGNLDTWDPAFLDALAVRGFLVVTFDYSGLGLSTGARSYAVPALAQDASTWSTRSASSASSSAAGRSAAWRRRCSLATHPDRVSHGGADRNRTARADGQAARADLLRDGRHMPRTRSRTS